MIKIIKSANTNCFLLVDERTSRTVLIDAGCASDKNFIDKLQLDQNKIDLLILTHGHYDHVGHAALLQKEYGIKVALHQKDCQAVQQAKMDFPPAQHFLGRLIRGLSIRGMEKSRYEAFVPDIVIEDQDFLTDFENFQIVYCPGHTNGSIGIIFENYLFAGDLVMNLPVPSPSMFADDFTLLKHSIDKAKQLKVTRIYPSHGSSFSSEKLLRF